MSEGGREKSKVRGACGHGRARIGAEDALRSVSVCLRLIFPPRSDGHYFTDKRCFLWICECLRSAFRFSLELIGQDTVEILDRIL